MDIHYGGVIWTNHALNRLKQRGITQKDAWTTWRYPDQSRYAKNRGAWIYLKTIGKSKIEVVAKKNEKREWIILSIWSKNLYGYRLNKRSFWSLLVDKLLRLIA